MGLTLCVPSMATELLSVANHSQTVEALTTQADATNTPNDALSQSALSNLQAIDNDVSDAAKPTASAENMPSNTAPNLSATVTKNPYSQLVSLAFKGKGVNGVNNYAEAAEQFCRDARDYNDANAQFALGWMYANGRGVEKNENTAALYFSKAAQQGHASAKNWLANTQGNIALAKPLQCVTPPALVITVPNQHADTSDDNSPAFYSKGPVYQLVAKLAPRFNIDTDLAMAFIAVESGFNPKATSAKNARGLMQLIPETAARFNVKNAYDPEQNIKGGLAYLQWLLTYFNGDVQLVAAAYNSGENAVDRYKGVPPYPETRKYVKKISTLYKKAYHPFNESANGSKKSTLNKVAG